MSKSDVVVILLMMTMMIDSDDGDGYLFIGQ